MMVWERAGTSPESFWEAFMNDKGNLCFSAGDLIKGDTGNQIWIVVCRSWNNPDTYITRNITKFEEICIWHKIYMWLV